MKTSIESYRASKKSCGVLAAGLAGLVLAAAPAFAQNTDVWSGGGGDGKWGTGPNWLGGVAPIPGTNLLFSGTVRTSNTNNLPTDTLINNITFGTPSGFFNLAGNEITLGGNITNNQIVTVQTISLPLLLNNSPSVTVVSNGVLTLGGNISGANSVTVNGGGTVNLTGNNSFTGGLTVNNLSTINVGADTNVGPGNLVLNTGTLGVTANVTLNATRGIAVGPGFGGFSVPTALTLSSGSVIADNGGAGGLTKSGYGTLDLFGANTYSGTTSNTIGTLVVDFTQATAPTNNIINASSPLELGGGNAGGGAENIAKLIVAGGAAPDSQTFNGTFATFGGSAIIATNKANQTLSLNLGMLSHSPGGTISFAIPTNAPQLGGGNNVNTTSANVNGILGGWALISGDSNAPTIVPQLTNVLTTGTTTNFIIGTNYAVADANGNIVNFTGYLPVNNSSTIANQIFGNPEPNIHIDDTGGNTVVNVDSDGNNTTTDVNAIKWTTARGNGYDGISIGQGNTLRLGQYGGILRNGLTNTTVIFGGPNGATQGGSGTAGTANIGTLTAGGPLANTPGEIVVQNNLSSLTTGTIIFESKITDNGSGAVTFVKMGPGSIKIDGNNTFSGGLYLLQGRVQFAGSEIGNANPDAGGSGQIYVLPGAYLFPSGIGGGIISNNISVAGNGDISEKLGAFRGGTYAGTITLIGDANFGGGATFDGPIVGPYNLTLGSGAIINGGVTLNTNNNWTGNTIMTARNNSGGNVITCGATNAIPSGFGYGNVSMVGFSGGTISWDLNSYNQTINGLSSSGTDSHCMISNSTGAATLTIGNNDQSGNFAGIIANGGGTLALTKIGGGVLTLSASNSYSGATIVNGGTLALNGAGSINASSSITVNNGATLDLTAASPAFSTGNPVTLSGGTLVGNGSVGAFTENNATNLFDINPNVTNVVASSLTLGGSANVLNIDSVSGVASYPTGFPLVKYSGALSGTLNYSIGTVPNASTGGFFSNDVADSIIYLVLTNGPAPETWTGTDPSNPTYWDFVTTNWLAFKGTPAQVADAFGTQDPAIFDDTASTGTVMLQTNVDPSFVTFSNNTLAYTLSGPGSITGVAGMAKYGTALVTLNDIGNDSFTKGVAVNQGTLIFATNNAISGGVTIASGATAQVGQNTGFGSLPTGNVTDNGTIDFDIGANATAANSFSSGTGVITKTDNSILTFSGNNGSFPGTITVQSGVLRAGSGTAFGTNTTTVSSGATVDLNGQTLNTSAQVVVSGTGYTNGGAIVNFGSASSQNGLDSVTLTGDTTFGGTNRWDIRGNYGSTTLSTGGNAYNITKIGTNFVGIVNATVDGNLGNIDIQQGEMDYEGGTTGLGNSSATLTVETGATFQIYNATNALNKNIVLNGSGTNDTINSGSGSGNLNGILGPVTVNGSTWFNNASGTSINFQNNIGGTGSIAKIGAGNSILSSGGTYTGATTLSNGTWTVDGTSSSSAITIYSGATLAGISTVGGVTMVSPGTNASPIISPGDPSVQAQSTLSISGNLTMNTNSECVFELSPNAGFGNDSIAISGNLNLNGTNIIKIVPLSFMSVGSTYTLFTFSGVPVLGTSGIDVTNLLTIQAPANGFFGFSMIEPSNTPGSIQITVTKAVGNDIWTGAHSTAWDTATQNWSRNSSAATFNNGDFVTFDDTSTITNVSVTGLLTNSSFTEAAYGEGYNMLPGVSSACLTGSGGINLQGAYLMIACSNTMSGTNLISSTSVLQLGNNTTNGAIGTGPITNSGVLILDRSDTNLVIPGVIAGTGSISNAGSGIVRLTGANSFSGQIVVDAGTLQAMGATALGSTNGPGIVVSNGATLDISNTVQVYQETITASGQGVGGNGAIVNNLGGTSYTGNQGNWENLTMVGDLTIGGNGRMDMRSPNSTNYASGGPGAATLSTGGNPYNLTKVGSNQMQFANVVVDPALSNIYVGGSSPSLLAFQGLDTIPMLGNPAGTIIISNQANFQLYDASNAVMKFMTIQDGGEFSNHGSNEFDGPITFTSGTNGWNRIDNGSGSLLLANQISGPGTLLKTGGNPLYLSLAQTNSVGEGYTGNTLVQQGQLALLDNVQLTNSPVILVSNGAMLTVTGAVNSLTLGTLFPQTLGGTGTIVGNVTENANSLVYPSLYRTNNPGNLTFSNTTVLNGTLQMGLNRNVSPNNDELVASSLTVSGPLIVTNVGPDLHVNDHFVLFSQAVSGFSSITLPNTNSTGGTYQWKTNLAVDGSITLTNIFVSSPTTNATITKAFLVGTNLIVQGTNNNVPNTSFHYVVLVSTNIAKPLTTWTPVVTNSFVAGGTNFFYTNPVAPRSSGTNRLFIDVKAVP